MAMDPHAPMSPAQLPAPATAALPLAQAAALPTEPWPSAPGLKPLDIIGRDDRQPVPDAGQPPWCLVCHLLIEDSQGRTHTGTGWLAGPFTVFTAGHNLLYRRVGHQARRVWVVPGRQGAQAPLGIFESTQFDVHPQWRAGDSAEVDVGVVWLPPSAGPAKGWFGFSAQPDPVLQGLAVRSSGYPDDRLPFGSQWFTDSQIHRVQPQMLAYGLDTLPGQSGSPVFALDASGRAVAVGVHVYGAGHENLGVRISRPIFDQLSAWWR